MVSTAENRPLDRAVMGSAQDTKEAAPDFSETAPELRCYPVGMTGFEPAAP